MWTVCLVSVRHRLCRAHRTHGVWCSGKSQAELYADLRRYLYLFWLIDMEIDLPLCDLCEG